MRPHACASNARCVTMGGGGGRPGRGEGSLSRSDERHRAASDAVPLPRPLPSQTARGEGRIRSRCGRMGSRPTPSRVVVPQRGPGCVREGPSPARLGSHPLPQAGEGINVANTFGASPAGAARAPGRMFAEARSNSLLPRSGGERQGERAPRRARFDTRHRVPGARPPPFHRIGPEHRNPKPKIRRTGRAGAPSTLHSLRGARFPVRFRLTLACRRESFHAELASTMWIPEIWRVHWRAQSATGG